MQILEHLIKVNATTRPGTHLKPLKGVVMHYTAFPGGSARGVRKWYSMEKETASAHYAVDDAEIVRIIPENEMAYHVGAKLYTAEAQIWLGAYPNNCTVGIEMCIDAAGQITAATRSKALELCVDILRRHKLTHGNVWRHYDITTKPCPLPWVERESAWFDFLGEVQIELARPLGAPRNVGPTWARPGMCVPA